MGRKKDPYFTGDNESRGGVYDDEFSAAREQLGVGNKRRWGSANDNPFTKKSAKDDESLYNPSGAGQDDEKTKLSKFLDGRKAKAIEKDGPNFFQSKSGKIVKGRVALAAASFFGLPALIISLILYLGLGLSVENISRLQTAYRYGQFHNNVGKVARKIMLADLALSNESRARASSGLLDGGRTRLTAKLPGWSPAKALTALGASDVKLNFDRVDINGRPIPGTSKLVSFEVGTGSNRQIVSSGGPNGIGEGRMLAELGGVIDTSLAGSGKGFFFRYRSVNHILGNSGVVLSRFRAIKAARATGTTLSRAEADRVQANERHDISLGPEDSRFRSQNPQLNADAEANAKEIRETGKVVRGRRLDANARARALGAVSKTSDVMFVATLYCIVKDISGSLDEAMQSQLYKKIRTAKALSTESDMFRLGTKANVQQEDLRNSEATWRGANLSQEYAMATGRPLSTVPIENRYEEAESPFKLFGLELPTIETINSTFGTFDGILNVPLELLSFGQVDTQKVCNTVMNPWASGGVAVAEVAVTLFTGGVSKVGAKTFTQIGKAVAKGVAGGVVFDQLVLYLQGRIIDAISGAEDLALPGEAGRIYMSVGQGNHLAMTAQAQAYTGPISSGELSAQQRESVIAFQEQERSKGFMYAYFSPNSPFSLTSSLTTSLSIQTSSFMGLSNWFNPINFFGFMFGGAYATEEYDPEQEFYGMQNHLYGFESYKTDGSDPRYEYQAIVDLIESDIQAYVDTYGECLIQDIVDIALERVPAQCNNEDADLFKMYYLFCETIDAISRVGSAEDSFSSSECNDLAGEYSSEFSSIPTASSANTSGSATTALDVDLTGPVYGPGIDESKPQRAEVQSGDSIDWSSITPSGTIGPDSNQEPIEVYVRESIQAENQKTVLLVSSIHGSENAGQLVSYELLFKKELPPNVRVIAVPELCSCAGTGSRGNSGNHEGLPIDLNRNFPYRWDSLPSRARVPSDESKPGRFYSKGASAGSENETKAFINFANSVAPEVDLLVAFHDGITWAASANNTPVSVAQAYVSASNQVIPLRGDESGTVSQRGSLDGWFNDTFGKNSLLIEMGSGAAPEQRIDDHVNGVLGALGV